MCVGGVSSRVRVRARRVPLAVICGVWCFGRAVQVPLHVLGGHGGAVVAGKEHSCRTWSATSCASSRPVLEIAGVLPRRRAPRLVLRGGGNPSSTPVEDETTSQQADHRWFAHITDGVGESGPNSDGAVLARAGQVLLSCRSFSALPLHGPIALFSQHEQ